MGVLIRHFFPEDAAAVNAVALEAFEQYQGAYNDWETLSRAVGSMASLAQEAEIIVAEDSQRGVVGAVAYCPPHSRPRADFFEPEWPIIRMLVVDPEHRGKGIGRSLTQECVDRARRIQAPLVSLHTSPVMEVALGMYLRMGFQLHRRVPDRFGVPYGVYTLSLMPE